MIMLNETWINGRVKAEEFIEKTLPIIEVMKHAYVYKAGYPIQKYISKYMFKDYERKYC